MDELIKVLGEERVQGFLDKAASAASAEDVAKIAVELGAELTAEQAAMVYERLCADVALSSNEADGVSGGRGTCRHGYWRGNK